MVGQIVGFIDDGQHLLLLEMFLEDTFVYDSKLQFCASFICLDDFKTQKNSKGWEKIEKLRKIFVKAGKLIWDKIEIIPK